MSQDTDAAETGLDTSGEPEPDVSSDAPPDSSDVDGEPDTPEVGDVPDAPDVSDVCVPTKEVCDGVDNDCDGATDEADNGEPLTASDVDHCGTCNAPCLFGEAAGRCVEGSCVLDACAPGTLDLDQDGRNGCETTTGKVAEWRLETGNVERLVDADPWYFVLDGRAVWMYLTGTGELVDHIVLPGAFDGAWHGGRSLLVVAGGESVSVLSVGDAGMTWRGFLPAPRDELVRAAVSGDHAYLANDFNRNGDSRLWVVNISDPGAPFLEHQEGTLRGTTDVAILDPGHLVTVSASIGVSVYSLADPVHPFLLSYADNRSWPSTALTLDRERQRAYVAVDRSVVNIFDLSDPESITKVGSITDRTPNQSVLSMVVDGDDLWTTDLVRVRRFDVSDAADPRRYVLQSLRGAGPIVRLGGEPVMVLYDGYGNTLNEYSVTSARIHPVELLSSRAVLAQEVVLYEGEDRYGVERAFAMGTTVLTATESGELSLHEPEVADGRLRLGPSLWREYIGAFDVSVEGNVVYVVAGSQNGNYYRDSDLVVFRMDEPAQGLVEVGRGSFPCGVNGIIPYELTVAAGRAYVMCGSYYDRRVEVVDLTDETTPTHERTLGTQVGAFHVTATDRQLVIGSQRDVLYRPVVQMSGYTRPVTDTTTPSWRHDPGLVPTDLARQGDILYLWDERGQMDLMDIGFRDAFSPVDNPMLPGLPLGSTEAPPVSLGFMLMPTSAGVVVLGSPDGRDGPATAPRALGQLTLQPTPLTGAAILPQGAILIEPRRVLTVPFTR